MHSRPRFLSLILTREVLRDGQPLHRGPSGLQLGDHALHHLIHVILTFLKTFLQERYLETVNLLAQLKGSG